MMISSAKICWYWTRTVLQNVSRGPV